jgi:hypothetical protein
MSLQPGSSYVNYLAVKKLLPLDDYANPYPSTTIFAVDSSGTLAGYSPDAWFSTIGIPNPSTLQGEIVSTIGIINSALGSTTYGLVSTMGIVNKDVLTSSLTSTVAGLAVTTGVSQAQLDSVIKNLGTTGYVSSTQLASTVAGLGTAGYLSTGADGLLRVRALSTGSVSLSTLTLVDTADPAQAKLLYNKNGGLFFGASQLGGNITDLSLNTLDVSNATVYQNLTVGGSVYVPYGLILAPNVYSDTISTAVVNAQKEAIPRSWAISGFKGDSQSYISFSNDNGDSWTNTASIFNDTNNVIYINGIWFALGTQSSVGVGGRGILYSADNGASWNDVIGPNGVNSFNNANLYSIAYNGSSYLLVGQKSGVGIIWTSVDGINWSYLTSPPGFVLISDVYYNGIYWVICGNTSGSSPVQYSTDGINWSQSSGFTGNENLRSIIYNGHTMLIRSYDQNDYLYYSTDKGQSWSAIDFGNVVVSSISWNGTIFIVGLSNYQVYTSRDGINWTYLFTHTQTIKTIFWNGRVLQAMGDTTYLESVDGYTWTPKDPPTGYIFINSNFYSVDVRDDLITTNARYYGVDIPHYYDSTNQIYAGPDRLVLNDTLTIKDGLVGVMKGDPGVHLDIEGAARASTLMTSTLQLADPLGQTVVTGRSGMMYINDIPIVQSTVAGLGQTYVSIPSLTSTVAGLGKTYVSIPSLTSTVAGLGQTYVSIPSLTSTVAGLGTAGYVSTESLIYTINNLGSFPGYVSSQSLTSTVGSLLTNLTVSSFSASTIGYAKLFTSTVYVGNDNASTNLIRFYGTSADGGSGSDIGRYGHTVISERIYSTTQSELLLFKGNDGAYPSDVDRIRHLAGTHQFDIISRSDTTTIWYDGSGNPPQPDISAALFIGTNGFVGIGTNTPQRALHVRPPADNGVVRLDRVIGSGPAYHLHYFDSADLTTPWKGYSMSVEASGANNGKFNIGDLQQNVAGFAALPRLTIDTSGSVGIGMTNPQAMLDISGPINSGYTGINTQGTITLANNDPYHKLRFVTTNGASYIQSDVSGIVQAGESKGTGIGNNLYFSRWNGSGITMTVDTSGRQVGIGTTTPSYSLDVSGSFYASTINYAKLYTSTVYVGNDNASTNMIRFYGVAGDGTENPAFKYSHTVIAERVYDEPTKSELLLFKGNDGIASSSGPDRIRHLAGAHQFDVITSGGSGKIWYDGSGNPPPADISGLLYMDGSGNGRVGINTTTPGATLDVSGYIKGKFVGFHTRYTGSGIDIGANTKITQWNDILHNVGNGWNGSTGYFTAPVSGYYTFSVVLYGNGDSNPKSFTIRKGATNAGDGTEYTGSYQKPAGTNVNWSYISATALIQLNATETVSVWSGIGGVGIDSIPVCSFCGHLIMPS